jgi:hypothetical protein
MAVKLDFKNLNYKITVKNDKAEIKKGAKAFKELHILKNCTGVALPG